MKRYDTAINWANGKLYSFLSAGSVTICLEKDERFDPVGMRLIRAGNPNGKIIACQIPGTTLRNKEIDSLLDCVTHVALGPIVDACVAG